MTDQSEEKTALETSRDIISQLKEIQHYSVNNIEKLSSFFLLLDDELKQKEFSARVEKLLNHQGAFEDELESFIEDFEMECNRIENEA